MKKLFFVLAGLALFGCKKEEAKEDFSTKPVAEKTELAKKADNFFKSISTFESTAIAQNKIDLGKKLYYDKALSKNGTISCNSCHNLATYGVDNKSFSVGDTKELGGRTLRRQFMLFCTECSFGTVVPKMLKSRLAVHF